VNFRKRHPLQLASTLGFILNKRKGHFPGLKEEEKTALHECLTWLRQPGNNPVCFYGQELEIYDQACKRLMQRIKQLLPEGSNRARIRATSRATTTLQDGSLGDTLGDEARGLVVLDFEGHPHKFDELQIMADVVAKEINVLKIDAPQPEGRGWKRTFSEIDTQDDLGEEWRQDMVRGAKYVLEESHVKANDAHYDAKCYPHMHPYDPLCITLVKSSDIAVALPEQQLSLLHNGGMAQEVYCQSLLVERLRGTSRTVPVRFKACSGGVRCGLSGNWIGS
jgi:hypothetical protein